MVWSCCGEEGSCSLNGAVFEIVSIVWMGWESLPLEVFYGNLDMSLSGMMEESCSYSLD